MNSIRWTCLLSMVAVLAACGGGVDYEDNYGSSSSKSSSSASGCDGKPEGAYKCDGSTGISHCERGAWVYETSCSCSVKVGDPRKPPYATNCKIVIGTPNAVECSYAGESCKVCKPGSSCY